MEITDPVKLRPVTAERARLGAYTTMPMSRVICREKAREASRRAVRPNLCSRYLECHEDEELTSMGTDLYTLADWSL